MVTQVKQALLWRGFALAFFTMMFQGCTVAGVDSILPLSGFPVGVYSGQVTGFIVCSDGSTSSLSAPTTLEYTSAGAAIVDGTEVFDGLRYSDGGTVDAFLVQSDRIQFIVRQVSGGVDTYEFLVRLDGNVDVNFTGTRGAGSARCGSEGRGVLLSR